jgi:hypothetical protein
LESDEVLLEVEDVAGALLDVDSDFVSDFAAEPLSVDGADVPPFA